MNKIQLAWHLYRSFGAGWLAYRVGYALRKRSGLLRWQIPAASWEAHSFSEFLESPNLADPQVYLDWRKTSAPRFIFDPAQRDIFKSIFGRWDDEDNNPTREAELIADGVFRYFAAMDMPVGYPPDWHCNPFNGESISAGLHWSQIDDFGKGDIKGIWDLNRFRFAFILVRAYWRTGDERYPELFWRLVVDWREHNPPQLGPNWMCGQEASFRVMAWCFGLYGFLYSPATTPKRVVALAQMIAVTGERIEFNLRHALSQQNNHGVSEGVGLWTIGLLFPELRSAERWLSKGQAVLESLGCNLIYPDGAFVQHSTNYQRLALHDYIWAIRLGQVNDRWFSQELLDRVKKAGQLLYQIQDADSGEVPCLGHNDGSLILPLNTCAYPDYRPVIQATAFLIENERYFPDGPWDEDLLWLYGPQALLSPVNPRPQVDLRAEQGGYYTLRSRSGFAFIHCASYHHRPAHADTLNLDLWWRGRNITLDPGTYSYNAKSPWDYALAGGYYHNAVQVDEQDPMQRVGRFLWLPWAKGVVAGWQHSDLGHLAYWEGEQDGYQQLASPVRARRGIVKLGDDAWLVLDRLEGTQPHSYRLQWLLPDVPYTWDKQSGKLVLNMDVGHYHIAMGASSPAVYSLVRADEKSPRGWRSPCYQEKQPAMSVDCVVRAESLWMWTWLAPMSCQVTFEHDVLSMIADSQHTRVHLAPRKSRYLIQELRLTGEKSDWLKFP